MRLRCWAEPVWDNDPQQSAHYVRPNCTTCVNVGLPRCGVNDGASATQLENEDEMSSSVLPELAHLILRSNRELDEMKCSEAEESYSTFSVG